MKVKFGKLKAGDAFFVPGVWRKLFPGFGGKTGGIDTPVLLYLGDSWIVNEGEVYKTFFPKTYNVVIVRREE